MKAIKNVELQYILETYCAIDIVEAFTEWQPQFKDDKLMVIHNFYYNRMNFSNDVVYNCDIYILRFHRLVDILSKKDN